VGQASACGGFQAAPTSGTASGRESPAQAKARPTGQYDASLSVTDVALFYSCPRKYYLERYLGLDSDPDADATEAAEAARRFHSSELGRRAARASRIEREFDFLLAAEDVLVAGQIDLWFEEGGELILVDYKTTCDESAAGEYELQLRLYALALERYAGRLPDRAVLFFSLSGNVMEVSLTSEDLESARAAIRSLSAAQESLAFPMNPGQRCHRCAFFQNRCPAELGAFAFGGHFPLQRGP
jgi:CRISPR-associated protein Cas4